MMASSQATLNTAQLDILKTQLLSGATALGIALSAEQTVKLLDYLQLLYKWSAVYNLSAIRAPNAIVSKHLLDSLSVVPHMESAGERIIDVGTGAGLPGIVLAIMFSQKHVTLLDAVGKKTRFLFQVSQDLHLDNVAIENARVEHFRPASPYDVVVSRAFASLKDMCGSCQHLLSETGKFCAMKGVFPVHELREVEKHYMVDARHSIDVPTLAAERCLLVISPRPPVCDDGA